MKRNNYNNYSKKRDEVIKDDIVMPVVDTEPEVTDIYVEPVVEECYPITNTDDVIVPIGPIGEIADPGPTFGIVEYCVRLNVRENPNPGSNVVSIVDAGKELMLILDESTNDWYKVCTTSGVEGYCMKEYISIK